MPVGYNICEVMYYLKRAKFFGNIYELRYCYY